MNSRLLSIGILLFSIMIGCDQSRIYETNTTLDDQLWIHDSILYFDFEINNSKQQYNILTNIQYANDFDYRNLYMKYTLYDSLDTEISTSLINTKLFSDKLGQPFGSSAIGDLYELQDTILASHTFPKRGKYCLSLQQYMRVDSLYSLSAIGIRVEESRLE